MEHPRCTTPAVTVRFGVVRIRIWATSRGLIRASGRGKSFLDLFFGWGGGAVGVWVT